jgi:hypothetical protein
MPATLETVPAAGQKNRPPSIKHKSARAMLSPHRYCGGTAISALASIKNNPRHKKRPITLAEHA